MSTGDDEYGHFVDHPRYGRGPRITGLNPKVEKRGLYVGWRASSKQTSVAPEKPPEGQPSYLPHTKRIPFTAIVADTNRQTFFVIPISHYFDLEKRCRDCTRPFIFFAEEQQHWYEELGFSTNSDCVRCVECRKKQQGLAQARELYETLFHVKDRTIEQNLQMAEACLSLIESGDFNRRQTGRVRMLLNLVPDDAHVRNGPRFADIVARLNATLGNGE